MNHGDLIEIDLKGGGASLTMRGTIEHVYGLGSLQIRVTDGAGVVNTGASIAVGGGSIRLVSAVDQLAELLA